jgi:hypothetical protein
VDQKTRLLGLAPTHGFLKKTRKTPREEMELAKRYRHDWLMFFGGGV